MFRKRIASVLTMAVLGLVPFVVLAEPAAAATSVTDNYISNLSDLLLAVALPITLLVEGVLFYAIWKFRKADEAKPTQENRRLELTWTVATAVVLMFVGLAAYSAMGSPYVLPSHTEAQQMMDQPNTTSIHVDAYQWSWEFHYKHNGTNFTSSTLVMPANKQIVLEITSRDVDHSFHAPALGLKRDAIPGRTNYIATRLNSSAVRSQPYQLYCAEFCGAGHSNMLANIVVMNQSDYNHWADQQVQAAQNASSGSSSGNASTTSSTSTSSTSTSSTSANGSSTSSTSTSSTPTSSTSVNGSSTSSTSTSGTATTTSATSSAALAAPEARGAA